jgi:hypothetical protein
MTLTAERAWDDDYKESEKNIRIVVFFNLFLCVRFFYILPAKKCKLAILARLRDEMGVEDEDEDEGAWVVWGMFLYDDLSKRLMEVFYIF